MFAKTCLNPSIFDGKSCLRLNSCMHDYVMLKNIEYMVGLRSTMLESRENMSFGKDYDFNCTCNKGSTKFPKLSTAFEHCRLTGLTRGPTTFER